MHPDGLRLHTEFFSYPLVGGSFIFMHPDYLLLECGKLLIHRSFHLTEQGFFLQCSIFFCCKLPPFDVHCPPDLGFPVLVYLDVLGSAR